MEFSQHYLFEDLVDSPTFFQKRMFGGLALYYEGLMVALLMEDPVQDYYKDKKFKHPIWNGILIPTDRDKHQELLKLLPGAESHPVLAKWLYLPLSSEDYESSAQKLVELIMKKSPLVGIVPGLKKRKKKAAKKKFIKKAKKKPQKKVKRKGKIKK